MEKEEKDARPKTSNVTTSKLLLFFSLVLLCCFFSEINIEKFYSGFIPLHL
jgi:hypothetical protein